MQSRGKQRQSTGKVGALQTINDERLHPGFWVSPVWVGLHHCLHRGLQEGRELVELLWQRAHVAE